MGRYDSLVHGPIILSRFKVLGWVSAILCQPEGWPMLLMWWSALVQRRKYICFWLVLCLFPPGASASMFDSLSELAADIEFSGYIKNDTAFRYLEPRSFTKIRNTLSLRAKYPINDMAELTVGGWYYHDLVYQLFNYDTVTARAERDFLQPLNFIEALNEEQDSNVLDVREFYLDLFLDRMDIRLGRQQVIWGVMTGVRIVDEINPMDFRELILLDLLDYRIPLWTLKADYYLDNSTLELLWIPDIKFHKPAPSGSEWELLQEVPGTVFPDSMTIRNSEYGIKWSGMLWDTELSLSYLDTWDDFPVIFRKVRVDRVVEEPEFYPTYTRIKMLGTTFQRQIGATVLKGEFSYVLDKFFGLATVDRDGDGYLDNQGELKKDHVRWGIGLDFNLFKTDFSPGIMQWIILDYDSAIIQDQFDTSLNLFVRKELPEQKAVFQMLAVSLVTLRELYLKPEITFSVTDRFSVGAGVDLFFGKPSQVGVAAENGRAVDLVEIVQRFQFVGNFNRNKRLFMEFKYSF